MLCVLVIFHFLLLYWSFKDAQDSPVRDDYDYMWILTYISLYVCNNYTFWHLAYYTLITQLLNWLNFDILAIVYL